MTADERLNSAEGAHRFYAEYEQVCVLAAGLPDGDERKRMYRLAHEMFEAYKSSPFSPKAIEVPLEKKEAAQLYATFVNHGDSIDDEQAQRAVKLAERLEAGLATPLEKFVGGAEFYVAMVERADPSASAYWAIVQRNEREASLSLPKELGVRIRAWTWKSEARRVRDWPDLWGALAIHLELQFRKNHRINANAPRRGRLKKAESDLLKTRLLAELREHPTMADDPAKLARLVGVSESTARRWIDQARKRFEEGRRDDPD